VSWRAIGCGTLAAVAFVGISLFAISRATAPAECPDLLPYEPASYEPVGERTDEPQLEGIDEALERAGTTSFGLASWELWVEPGRVPSASGEPLPQRIVLDCRDGTFQAFQRGTE
jgi:hypothetical protein